MKLVVNNKGDFTYSGNWHDSGSDNYRLNLGIMLKTRSGIAYDFIANGHADGHDKPNFVKCGRNIVEDKEVTRTTQTT